MFVRLSRSRKRLPVAEEIEDRLAALRARQQEAQRRRATADARLDQVQARKAELLAGLKEQGFDSPEEARAHVQELSKETEKILASIEEKVGSL